MKSNLELRVAEFDTSDIIKKFYARLAKLVREAKDKLELDEEEKFAHCVMSGMKLKTSVKDDGKTFVWETLEPAAVIRIDGHWSVVRNER